MWIYDQSDGKLYKLQGDGLGTAVFVASGYSGRDWAKNNPKAEGAKGLGPIPRGMWNITEMYDSQNVGPYALKLEPQEGTKTHGRSAFRIHGDSIRNPGSASRGCIILSRDIREMIWKSRDWVLRVVE